MLRLLCILLLDLVIHSVHWKQKLFIMKPWETFQHYAEDVLVETMLMFMQTMVFFDPPRYYWFMARLFWMEHTLNDLGGLDDPTKVFCQMQR